MPYEAGPADEWATSLATFGSLSLGVSCDGLIILNGRRLCTHAALRAQCWDRKRCAGWAGCRPVPSAFQQGDWLPYLNACRSLATLCGPCLREVERALWVGANVLGLA